MRLKELRTQRHMLQKDVAQRLGIDRTTYAKYESGASEPNHETLLKLSELFDVSADYLLGREMSRNVSPRIPRAAGAGVGRNPGRSTHGCH